MRKRKFPGTVHYSGKLAEQVWDEWTPQQREHFLLDHQDLTGKDWNKDVLNTSDYVVVYSDISAYNDVENDLMENLDSMDTLLGINR